MKPRLLIYILFYCLNRLPLVHKKVSEAKFLGLMENEGNRTSNMSEIRFEPDIPYLYEILK